jgi:hypothetical protein
VFLHRGIAARQFQRAFVLAEGIEVTGAWLDSGLLNIDLARPQPEVRIRTIRIDTPAQSTAGATVNTGQTARPAAGRTPVVRPVPAQPRSVDTLPEGAASQNRG